MDLLNYEVLKKSGYDGFILEPFFMPLESEKNDIHFVLCSLIRNFADNYHWKTYV